MRANSRRASCVAVLVAASASVSAQQISTGCNAFLAELDNDSTLTGCATPLLQATSSFNPVNSSTSPNVQSTLSTICSSATQFCSDSLLQRTLNQFYGNCSAEMIGSNAVASISSLYDTIYLLPAFKAAICATDPQKQTSCLLGMADSPSAVSADANPGNSTVSLAQEVPAVAGNASAIISSSAASASASSSATEEFPVAQMQNNAVVRLVSTDGSDVYDLRQVASSLLSSPQLLYQAVSSVKSLAKRKIFKRQNPSASASASSSSGSTPANTTDVESIMETTLMPNATTFNDNYLHFLFLNPNMTKSQLCTPCTQEILGAYVAWESKQPYPVGISNSALLGSQITLWRAVNTRCGAAFASRISTIAGQTQFDSSASIVKVGSGIALAVSAIVFLL